jgi:hypothetical protein
MTLALVTVILLLGTALTRSLVIVYEQSAVNEQQHQALWLLESGIQRARAAATKSDTYRGEEWDVPAESLGSGLPGRVVVRVVEPKGEATGRKITVEATYPNVGTRRNVFVREVSM